MNQIKIMIVEDDVDQQSIFKDSARVYEVKHKVNYQFCDNVDDAISKIDGSFDGAIIDLKLKEQPEGGNTILKEMEKALFRVPVIFVTGHPDLVSLNDMVVRCRARNERTYAEDLDEFYGIYDTGLTRIMGGRGIIEQTLNRVFVQNLLPHRNAWVAYGQSDSSKTEKALLRFALNHLMQLLDDDEDRCFPEEVYLYPPLHEELKTGSIVKEKGGTGLRIVLNPACDLVIREAGKFNTDKILLIEIDDGPKVYDHVLKKLEKQEEKESKMQTILSNRHTLYHHWLPKTNFFPGGFINFRKLCTLSKKEFLKQFDRPHIQVSPHFVKDILSRFSSYYARQGQPDIECSDFISEVIAFPKEDR